MSEDVKREPDRKVADSVSFPLRVAAAWSWRILLVIALISLVLWLLGWFKSVVISVLVAMLVALLLAPFVNFLKKRLKMGRTSAAAVGLLGGLVIGSLLFGVALREIIAELPYLVSESIDGLNSLVEWVANGPLGFESDELQGLLTQAQNDLVGLLKENSGVIASEAWFLASSAISLAASTLIVLFTLFFLLRDGRAMWIVVVRSMPKQWRNQAHEAGIRAWVTLGWYIRTQTKVAAIDAAGIGLGALILGVPAAIPIGVLVFFLAYIPIVGAFLSGAVAILIALVNNGVTTAIIMFIIVLAVQQLEGNVLQPWLMSQAVSLHPLAVVLAVAVGGAVAGIIGAIFAVPLLAVLNVVFLYLHGHDPNPALAHDVDRPGGPPGTLEEQIALSYQSASTKKSKDKKDKKDKQKDAAPQGTGSDASGGGAIQPA